MDKKTIHDLSALCRISCTEEEEAGFEKDFASILGYFKQLEELDTESVQPLDHVIQEVHNVFRDDVVKEVIPRQTFLDNTPSQIGGMVRVPIVIKGNS